MPVPPSRGFHPRRRFFARCCCRRLRLLLLLLLLLPAVLRVPPSAAIAGAQRLSVAERGAAGCEEVARRVDDLGRVLPSRAESNNNPTQSFAPRGYHPVR